MLLNMCVQLLIGTSLNEPHTSVTALRTRVSIRLSDYLWTDHLPEILNLRIYEISKCTSEREGLLSLLPDCRVSVKESKSEQYSS